ncbi:alpha/beta hydrolase [Streptomyces bacillaris]|uniref:alpha/beta hydrolase n=1 Tax=Streptomyces bacillaris TaxID=68179 RepID=UPI0036F67CF9
MRPALLFIHGIGGPRDPEKECGSWLAALAVGARRAGHASVASALEHGGWADAAFAHYGDLFARPHAQGESAFRIGAGEDEELRHLLEEMIHLQLLVCPNEDERRVLQHARAELTSARQAQGSGDLVRRLVNVCTTLLALPGLQRGGQWVSGRIMAGHLAQVTRYLSRAEPDGDGRTLDERVRERVLALLGKDRSTVVVAHSLGTVVALEALYRHCGPVPLLVTLGSPIGMRTVVHSRLRPQPPATPDCVGRWLNYWDRDDIIAPRPLLERDILPNAHGGLPESDRVDSDGIWVHTATKYLAQPGVAGPVVEAVRLAAEEPSA